MIELALYLLLVGTLLSPFLRDGAALALLGLLIAKHVFSDRDGSTQVLPQGWGVPVVSYVAANVGAAAASPEPAAALVALGFLPIGLLIFVGTVEVVRAGGSVRLAQCVLAIVLVFAADTLWQVAFGQSLLRGQPPVNGRFMGSLSHPTNISLLPILLPLGVAPLQEGSSRLRRLAVVGSLPVALAVAVSGTRAAWLALLGFFVLVGPITGSRRTAIVLASVFAVTFAAAAVFGPFSSPRRLLLLGLGGEQQRLVQWKAAAELFGERPLLGWGPHSFRTICAERHDRAGSVFERIDLEQAPYPHNIYLEAAAETGLVGLGALLFLLGTATRALRSAVRDSYAARAAAASLGLFLGIGLVDLSFVKDWVHLAFWLPIGIAAGIDQRTPQATGAGAGSSEAPTRLRAPATAAPSAEC